MAIITLEHPEHANGILYNPAEFMTIIGNYERGTPRWRETINAILQKTYVPNKITTLSNIIDTVEVEKQLVPLQCRRTTGNPKLMEDEEVLTKSIEFRNQTSNSAEVEEM